MGEISRRETSSKTDPSFPSLPLPSLSFLRFALQRRILAVRIPTDPLFSLSPCRRLIASGIPFRRLFHGELVSQEQNGFMRKKISSGSSKGIRPPRKQTDRKEGRKERGKEIKGFHFRGGDEPEVLAVTLRRMRFVDSQWLSLRSSVPLVIALKWLFLLPMTTDY